MKEQFDPLEQILMTAAKTVDKSLLYALQKEMMKKEIFDKREKEQMIDEITNRVLSRISISLDTSDAIEKTKQLKKELENLTKFK